MANLVYKRSTTTSLKTAGLIDVENMTITVDGEDKKLSRLWKDFEGSEVEIVIKVRLMRIFLSQLLPMKKMYKRVGE